MPDTLYQKPSRSVEAKAAHKITVSVAVSAVIRLLPDEKAAQRAAEKRRRKLAKKYKRNAPQVIAQFNAELQREWAQFTQVQTLCQSLFSHEDDPFYADLALHHCLRLPFAELRALSEEIKTLADDERRAYLELYFDAAAKGHNHCHHQPEHLDFKRFVNPYDRNAQTDFQHKNRRPRLLYEAMERLLFACLNPHAFHRLFFNKTHYRVKRWQKCERQFRSEAREAMGKLLTMMVMHMDIYTSNVGFRKNGDFHGFSYAQLSHLTGMSKSRVRRAMQKMTKLGWIGSVSRYWQLPSGLVLNVAPLRTFNDAFFKQLGLSDFLRHEKHNIGRQYKKENDENIKARFEELEGTPIEKAAIIMNEMLDAQTQT